MDTTFYTLGDFTDADREQLMDEFHTRYGAIVEESVQKLIDQERSMVREICEWNRSVEEDDVRQTMRLSIYMHAPWIIRKSHLDPSRNIQGFIYKVMRNALVDLWRKSKRRGRLEVSFDSASDRAEPSGYDVVEAKSELESLLFVLIHRLRHIEMLLLRSNADRFLEYMCWWLDYRADFLSGRLDHAGYREDQPLPLAQVYELYGSKL